MKKIYVVYGQTGEYSDHSDWFVCAYEDQVLAERHADRAAEFAKKLFDRSKLDLDDPEFFDRYEMLENANPFDPKMRIDYTGTNYCALEVEVREELPVVE